MGWNYLSIPKLQRLLLIHAGIQVHVKNIYDLLDLGALE